MTTVQIIANVFGVLTALTFVISFQIRSNKKLFIVQALANTFYGVQFLLLGAWGGLFNTGIRIVRNLLLSRSDRWEWIRWKGWAPLFCVPSLIFMIVGWTGPVDILPFLATMASNLSYWSNDARKIRLAELGCICPSWIVYDLIEGAYGGILNEVLLMSSVIVSFVRFGWKGLEGSGDKETAAAAGSDKEEKDVQRDA